MSNLIQKLTAFVRSPQARTVIDQARRQAAKPENRRHLARSLTRFPGHLS